MKTFEKLNDTIKALEASQPNVELGDLSFNWTPQCVALQDKLDDIQVDGNASGNTIYTFLTKSVPYGRVDKVEIFSDDVVSAEKYARNYFVALHQERLGRRANPVTFKLYRQKTEAELIEQATEILENQASTNEVLCELGLGSIELPIECLCY